MKDELVEVTQAEAESIRDEMIAAARRLADREGGAMQSEMRLAQIGYLATILSALRHTTYEQAREQAARIAHDRIPYFVVRDRVATAIRAMQPGEAK